MKHQQRRKQYSPPQHTPIIYGKNGSIKYAKEGFRLLPGEATRQQSVKDELLEFDGTRHHFMINDSLSYKAGDLFMQNDLAKVLEAIAKKGRTGFYEGEIAKKLLMISNLKVLY